MAAMVLCMAWAKPGEASKPEFLHMARPKRGRTRPTISLELDCDLESEVRSGAPDVVTRRDVTASLSTAAPDDLTVT